MLHLMCHLLQIQMLLLGDQLNSLDMFPVLLFLLLLEAVVVADGSRTEDNRLHQQNQNNEEVVNNHRMGLLFEIMQLPVGVVWVQTHDFPMWLWLKQPQKLYSPDLALPQSQDLSIATLGPFMKGMYHPSVNMANLATGPKAVLQRLSPTAQLVISRPRTGSVTAMMPPVQPQQKAASGLLQGVQSEQQLQKGLASVLGWMMQVTGSLSVQDVSPVWGLQPLQDILPTQLFLSYGQTVAWKVRPFFAEMLPVEEEQNSEAEQSGMYMLW